jgi:cell division septum initiation protein DivIVA
MSTMTRKVTTEAEEIRRRNAELERAVAEAAAREERLRRELEAALARLAVAEKAEERLCEYQAVEYQEQVRALSERLAFADGAMGSSRLRSVAAGVARNR